MTAYHIRLAELRKSDETFWNLCSTFYGDLRELNLFEEVELGLLGNNDPVFRLRAREYYKRLPIDWQFRADAFFAICARRQEAYKALDQLLAEAA